MGWAATGVSASLLLAPYLSNITSTELHVEDEVLAEIGRLEALLDARRVERGHRIELRRLPTRTTAQRTTLVRGVRCAPIVGSMPILRPKAAGSPKLPITSARPESMPEPAHSREARHLAERALIRLVHARVPFWNGRLSAARRRREADSTAIGPPSEAFKGKCTLPR